MAPLVALTAVPTRGVHSAAPEREADRGGQGRHGLLRWAPLLYVLGGHDSHWEGFGVEAFMRNSSLRRVKLNKVLL